MMARKLGTADPEDDCLLLSLNEARDGVASEAVLQAGTAPGAGKLSSRGRVGDNARKRCLAGLPVAGAAATICPTSLARKAWFVLTAPALHGCLARGRASR